MKRLAILLAVFVLAGCAMGDRPTAATTPYGTSPESAGAMGGAGAAGGGIQPQLGTHGLSGP